MASSDNISMAVFCDFENVALGVRDANYEKFDIKPVLERLLLKGSIVVKKAYCDWERYKGFKATMHEANFELIEIPHVRQSGKNSADIRLVVDALDLCYTKSHVNTFVIISGDSDFSPLVSKLRENAKNVIGVGVKQSTSDLLVANCDEFIFYDDLVREQRRAAAKRDERKAQPQSPAQAQGSRRPSDENNRKREEMEARKLQALEMVVETFDALVSERGDTGKIWASLLKDTLKRRRPDFSETYYGFRTFGNLLEEAQTRGLFEFGRDEKSGTYVFRSSNAQSIDSLTASNEADVQGAVAESAAGELSAADSADESGDEAANESQPGVQAGAQAREPRRRGGRGRKSREQQNNEQASFPQADAGLSDPGFDTASATVATETVSTTWPAPTPDLVEADAEPVEEAAPTVAVNAEPQTQTQPDADAAATKERRRAPRAPRKPAARRGAAAAAETPAPPAVSPDEVQAVPPQGEDAAVTAAADAHTPVARLATEGNPVFDVAVSQDVADEASADDEPGAPARKKSTRPAHKAPARKPAARSRRPAKPKTPPENG